MSTEEENKTVDSVEEKSLSCSLTFQNAIEIDFSKLREMQKEEEAEAAAAAAALTTTITQSTAATVLSQQTEDEDSLSTPVLKSKSEGTSATERDLSIYDKPLESNDPNSSSDEEEEEEEEPETEMENSEEEEEEEEEEDLSLQYEQLGSTEFTKANSDDEEGRDEGGSDGEFGDFESCPVSYQTMSEDDDSSHSNNSKDNRHASGGAGRSGSGRGSDSGGVMNESPSLYTRVHVPDRDRDREKEEEVEDHTQDVLGSQHPRTPAHAIPPLDQTKIDLIKKTMAGLTLKPLGGGGAGERV